MVACRQARFPRPSISGPGADDAEGGGVVRAGGVDRWQQERGSEDQCRGEHDWASSGAREVSPTQDHLAADQRGARWQRTDLLVSKGDETPIHLEAWQVHLVNRQVSILAPQRRRPP